jgi:hypothetical protein
VFGGEEAFWRSAGALRAAGYDSVLRLTQDIVNDNRPVLMILTREPENRGTQHIRLLIPRGIQGLSENDRVTLQVWLKIVDWTGMSCEGAVFYHRAINATRPFGMNNWIQLFIPNGLVAFIARIQLFIPNGLVAFIARW